MKHRLLLVASLLISNTLLANDMEFAISDEMAEASYQAYYSNNFNTRLSLLRADDDNLESNMLDFGLYANGNTGRVRSHLGGKLFWLDGEKVDIRGIALGGAIDAFLAPKLFLVLSAHYAPDILTGGDLDNYTDYGLRLSYQLLDNAAVFIGYRNITAEKGKYDYDAYDGGFAGFRFTL